MSVRYFAYGANMNSRVLKRRGISPITAQRASLAGFRLVFCSYASLVRDPAATVHGVRMTLSLKDFVRLQRFESGYGQILVQLRCGKHALTFVRTPPANKTQPTRRYLLALIQGAREAGLDERYVKWLELHRYRYTWLCNWLTPDSLSMTIGDHLQAAFLY